MRDYWVGRDNRWRDTFKGPEYSAESLNLVLTQKTQTGPYQSQV